MKNKDKSSFFCNNRCWQSSKRFCNFCKRFGHSIETCYHRNKLAVSIFATTAANTESVQPMAPVSAKSQSSGSTFTISRDDLINIIANVIRMVSNASYSSSLSALFGMSLTSWIMDFACCNHMIPHSSLFSELTKLYFRDWTLLLWLARTSKKLFLSQVPWIHVFLVGPKWMNEEASLGRLPELLLCVSSYLLFWGS